MKLRISGNRGIISFVIILVIGIDCQKFRIDKLYEDLVVHHLHLVWGTRMARRVCARHYKHLTVHGMLELVGDDHTGRFAH